ncbi:MAG: hypothetical protein U0905_15865 [Pirellulales bacterium]
MIGSSEEHGITPIDTDLLLVADWYSFIWLQSLFKVIQFDVSSGQLFYALFGRVQNKTPRHCESLLQRVPNSWTVCKLLANLNHNITYGQPV